MVEVRYATGYYTHFGHYGIFDYICLSLSNIKAVQAQQHIRLNELVA